METFEIIIDSKAGSDIQIAEKIPDDLKHFCLPVFEHMYAKANIGDMIFNYFEGDGFHIWNSVYIIKHSAKIKAKGNFYVLELHIPFHNDLVSKWDGKKQFQLKNRQFEMSYLPFVNNESEFIGGQTHHTFDIHYTKDYLLPFAEHFPLLDDFIKKAEKKKAASLVNAELFLSPSMISIINSMLQYDMRDVMAPFFFEGAILQFTTIFIERLSGINPDAPKSFSPYEIEQTYEAKKIMLLKLSTKYKIKELAHKVGINDWKLQACFKHLFGVTIYQYLLAARLDYAKLLLQSGKNYTMQDVAELVGYPDNSNFTAAFKRELGYTPEYFRKKEKMKK
ncbi:MAG TPA: AraC family transcriptional regulator [Puia sp.]|jgi:AraC-like DNA-binding protein|nr:AraC family transcriptional regulator [Puia sp.]